jgi:hypothetical protein
MEFNLAQFNPLAIELDLRILSADIAHGSIGVVANQVPSLVHASSVIYATVGRQGRSPSGVGDESFCSFDFVIEISTGNGRTFDHELAYTAHRHELVMVPWMHYPESASASGTDGARLRLDKLVFESRLVGRGSYNCTLCRSVR